MIYKPFIPILIAVILAITAIVVAVAVTDLSAFKAACRAKGGIPFTPHNGYICLKPDAVIRLP